MKKIRLGTSNLYVPAIAVGCMRMSMLDQNSAQGYIQSAIEQGATFFDHADIYGGGASEEIFGNAMQELRQREKIVIQSKCGIRKDKGTFDFSKEHIIASVEGSLKRLKTDYLDILLLHRPDALVEPEEVAEAFDQLEQAGKVRWFGVSNQNPMQIQLLQKYVKQPMIINQLQLSITNATMISGGINVNMENDFAVNRDGSILDFCRLNDITIQTWSPFQHGFFGGVFLDHEDFPELNMKINEIASKYQVSNTTIALAWILRHPAKMQPIVGTMNTERLKQCIEATKIYLTREEWYGIYQAAGNKLTLA